MGNLLDAARRGWAHRKLLNNRCLNCGAILPDIRPIAKWQALASYSIYIVHLVIINGFRDAIDLPGPVETVLFTAVGVLVGIGMYKFVEIPAHKLGQKLRKREASAPRISGARHAATSSK